MDKRVKKRLVVGGAALSLAALGAYLLIKHRRETRRAASTPWTTDAMPDLTGKVIIVTGANSGIGFEAAKAFARKGAQTILACRSRVKAQAALEQIMYEIPGAQARVMRLDLASLDSVRRFAETFRATYDRLDILLNNAGIMMVPYSTTEDGFERQIGTNHLGHFALTGLLIDLLLKTPGARVVNVSSNAHKSGTMDFDNLLYAEGRGYSPSGAYSRSKLANLLFTYELQRRFAAQDANAIAVAAHPGVSNTNLFSHFSPPKFARLINPLMARVLPDAAMGALPSIRAAVDPDVTGGEYFGPDGFREMMGYPVVVQATTDAHNETNARRLWQVSEELTGVTYHGLA